MKMDKRIKNLMPYTVYWREFVLALVFFYSMQFLLTFAMPFWIVFLIELLVMTTVIIWKQNGKRLQLPVVLILSVTIFLLIGFLKQTLYFLFVQDAVVWFYDYLFNGQKMNFYYALFFALFLSVFSIIFANLIEKIKLLKIAISFFMPIVLILATIYQIKMDKFVVLCCLLYILDTLSWIVHKKGSQFLLLFLFGMVFFAGIIPVNEQPIKWTKVKHMFASISDGTNELLYQILKGESNDEFGLNTSGFSEDASKIGGNIVSESKRVMFSLDVVDHGIANAYLTGTSKDFYTGNGWECKNDSVIQSMDDFSIDIFQKLKFFKETQLKSQSDRLLCKRTSYSVKYEKLKTKTILTPDNCYSIENREPDATVFFQQNMAKFTKVQKADDSYVAKGVVINMESPILLQYLRGESNVNSEEINSVEIIPEETMYYEFAECVQFPKEQEQDVTNEAFERALTDYQSRIESVYLQLPKGLPQRVEELTQHIIEGKQTDYQKAEAIRDYLKTNATYTKTPGEVPKDRDLVDYFLFDQKEGYCTYFATSMAVMCRCAGIPARYIEGTRVDFSEKEGNWYLQYGRTGHAWTEIYLKDFGWVRMEATPGFGKTSGDWTKKVVDYNGNQSYAMEYVSTDSVSENQVETTWSTLKVRGKKQIQSILITVAFMVLLVAVVILLFFAQSRYRYQRLDKREKVNVCMQKILFKLHKKGYGIQKGETVRMLKERLEKTEFWERSDLIPLLSWYEMIRYSEVEIDITYIARMEKILKEKRNWKTNVKNRRG